MIKDNFSRINIISNGQSLASISKNKVNKIKTLLEDLIELLKILFMKF